MSVLKRWSLRGCPVGLLWWIVKSADAKSIGGCRSALFSAEIIKCWHLGAADGRLSSDVSLFISQGAILRLLPVCIVIIGRNCDVLIPKSGVVSSSSVYSCAQQIVLYAASGIYLVCPRLRGPYIYIYIYIVCVLVVDIYILALLICTFPTDLRILPYFTEFALQRPQLP